MLTRLGAPHRHHHTAIALAGLTLLAWASVAGADPFVAFESGQVRPLALAPNGTRLIAVNTPDNQIESYAIAADGTLTHTGSAPVGLEPVAVAARTDTEVWVANHLSDSISIVDLSTSPPRVTRTLLVGDEPRDIVFAGPGGTRAFITTAHRGQHNPNDPQLTTPGVGRADVWVFDATNLGTSLGGDPLTIVTLFGDTPRALAVSPDGATVYAAILQSGNQTTAINEGLVCNGGAGAPPCLVAGSTMPGGLPAPNANVENKPGPEVGLVLKFDPNSAAWHDELGRNWNNGVKFSLPDKDVFAIDATANPPVETASFSGVGTVLFNMAVNPVSGKVYVSNTEARNEVRFEGPGTIAGHSVRGHLHEARITVLDGTDVIPRHLNTHIKYDVVPSPASTLARSLAIPTGIAVSGDGKTLYVAALGSNKIGVYNTAQLEAGTFTPGAPRQITVPGGGPTGLVLDEAVNRLYVLTRFDNAISVINPKTRIEKQHVRLHNPEPSSVVAGRPFLYDATLTSSNGEASCATCHVFADFDGLGWDLGNPDDVVLNNPNPFRIGPLGDPDFHPMKGPMTTQTLRGMATHGPMHWRGDRTGGNDFGVSPLDTQAAFKKFNVAFGGLLGRSGPLSDGDMQAFTDFILQVIPPPNPIRALDNSLTPDQTAGRTFYFNNISDGGLPCNGCHALDPSAGHFGTDGFSSFEGETQHLKIPHLRNVYQKVGMFGMPALVGSPGPSNAFTGEQIRGFGFLHDGSIDTVLRFLNAAVFNFPGGNPQRQQVEQFLFAYDTNLAPIVGQQITLTSTNGATVGPFIDLLIARAAVGECDLVVKGVIGGEPRGAYRTAAGDFQFDRVAEAPVDDASVRGLASTAGQELTYTCVPPGSGIRIGVDRDGDTVFDGDERDGGTDPAADTSLPPTAITCAGSQLLAGPSLRVTRNGNPAGDELLSLTGGWVVNPPTPRIDPLNSGFRFKVDDKDGHNIFARAIPRGAQPKRGAPGWKVNATKTKWTFTDRSGTLADGITRVEVRDESATTPGYFTFSVRGRHSNFQIDTAGLPAQVLVVLGGIEQGTIGQCATRAFNATGSGAPDCRVNGGTVVCN